MTLLFASIVVLLLLLLLKQSLDKLHGLIVVIVFFILLQALVKSQLFPLWQQLATLFQRVPYSKGLLYTALLLILKDLFCQLLEQLEYDAYAGLATLAIRITIVTYWVNEFTTPFQSLLQLLERL